MRPEKGNKQFFLLRLFSVYGEPAHFPVAIFTRELGECQPILFTALQTTKHNHVIKHHLMVHKPGRQNKAVSGFQEQFSEQLEDSVLYYEKYLATIPS